MRFPFGTQAYQHRSLPLSAQEMVNAYLEPAAPTAKTYAAVVATYGIANFAAAGTGPIRGGIVANDLIYVVSGNSFCSIDAVGEVTVIGTIPGVGACDLAASEATVMIVTANQGFYYNGATLQVISDPDFPGAEWVENFDGYYVIGAPNSGEFFISANRAPNSWDGLDFATAEKYPDNLVDGIADHGELILFGRESFEVWFDSGDPDFPLDRSSAGIGEVGLLSRGALAKIDNSVFFPGNDMVVYRLQGYIPQRVSTYAVEQAIESYADKTCTAYSWSEAGHKFVAFSFAEGTWVFDTSTNLWHKRKSNGLPRWRPRFTLRAFGKVIVGDYASNKLGYLSPDTHTQWGDVHRLEVTSPPLVTDNKRATNARLELVFETGVGTIATPDPQVALQFSDNGGLDWSNEKWRSLGRIGNFKSRVVWNRVGQARDRVYRYHITDPVRRTLILATLEAQVGTY